MENVLEKTVDSMSQYGPFAILFLLLFAGILWAAYNFFSKIFTLGENQIKTIVESNSKFAESGEKMAKLIEVLTEQEKASVLELVYIRKKLSRYNYVAREITNILSSRENNPEIKIRLENISRELEKPIDE